MTSPKPIGSMTNDELNEAVAVEVMGVEPKILWIARSDDGKPDAESAAYVNTSGETFPRDWPYSKADVEKWIAEHPVVHGDKIILGKWLLYPPYSTDIAAAWQVVEKMWADDWLVTIKCNTDAAQFIIEGSRSEYDAPCPDRRVGPKGSCVCEMTCMKSCRDNAAAWRPSEFAMHTNVCRAICIAALTASRPIK